MRLAPLALSSVALLSATAWFALEMPERAARPSAEARAPASAGTHGANGPAGPIEVERLEYRLSLERQLSVAGQRLPSLRLAGGLSTVPLLHRRGRVEMQLDATEVEGPTDTPTADAIAAPFHVARTAGHGLALGFERSVSPEARDLLGTVASAIQFTPGDGATWSVVEEDVTGRYAAAYTRVSPTTVQRTRRYLGMRTPTGFDPRQAGLIEVGGQTTFEHDARGLVRVHVDEVATFDLGEGRAVRAVVDVRLERVGAVAEVGRFGARWPLEGLSQASREHRTTDRDAAVLGDHTAASLLAAFDELDALPARSHATSKWRNTQLLRLQALVRTHPEAADDLAQAVVERADDGEPVPIDLLVGGLAQSQTVAGRDALLGLAANRLLPNQVRRRIAIGLGDQAEPTPALSATIAQMLEEGGLGSAPALALGNQARPLADTAPEAAQDAVDLLIDRYLLASDWSEKRTYLSALGNAGDPRTLPLMQEALSTPLAPVAAYGLRFIPGEAADALLMGIISQPGDGTVRAAAVNAVCLRNAAVWHPILTAVASSEADEVVLNALRRALATMPTS